MGNCISYFWACVDHAPTGGGFDGVLAKSPQKTQEVTALEDDLVMLEFNVEGTKCSDLRRWQEESFRFKGHH